MTAGRVSDPVAQKPSSAASIGKGPRTKKPRRRRRMLTGVSRQRRAANERERRRIQGVNNAFLELRDKIPVIKREDVSKIETLRLAAKWIAHLTAVLIQDDKRQQWSSETSRKCLPHEIQEKLTDLLSFEIEDFDLISNSDQPEYLVPASPVSSLVSDSSIESNTSTDIFPQSDNIYNPCNQDILPSLPDYCTDSSSTFLTGLYLIDLIYSP